jgi:hypothetical protein
MAGPANRSSALECSSLATTASLAPRTSEPSCYT